MGPRMVANKRSVARTVKFSEEEIEDFRREYYAKFQGSAQISDSTLLRYMAIRGCEALKSLRALEASTYAKTKAK